MSITIRVEKAPLGDNPEWVREAWVGLEIVAMGPAEMSRPQSGICGGPPPPVIRCYRVPAGPAFKVLERERPEAHAWFVRMCPDMDKWNSVAFNEECAVVVDG